MRRLIGTFLIITLPFLVISCDNDTQTKKQTIDLKAIIKKNNASAEINWVDVNQLDALMANSPKKVMFIFYRPGCPYCKKMKDETLRDPRVINAINENFYAVLFDGRSKAPANVLGQTFINPKQDPSIKSNHELHKSLVDPYKGNIYWPTTVFVDENYQKLRSYPGFQPENQLLRTLQNMKNR